ncbi:hypothetical protein C8J56DRAFT_1030450 [Mycena floridula]|nr:hypothetical protein C8J56DRAFT_1030450 [Mycena floridula]
MHKTITPFQAKLVTIEYDLPFDVICARLDKETNKEGTAGLPSTLKNAESKEHVVEGVNKLAEGRDFLHFFQINHSWMKHFHNKMPKTVVYTIGNPLIGESIMKHDIRAAYNIPPRLLVLESEDGDKTSVIYHLPSSVIVLGDNSELKTAALALDAKLDELLTKVSKA